MDKTHLLTPHRDKLDSINLQIAQLLSERMRICLEIAAIKARENIPMMQPQRIAVIQEKLANQAEQLQLRPEYLARLFQLIIEETCAQEARLIARQSSIARTT
ncbi:hypothetical protein BUE93_17775 [Chromobacterium amazonense]|uniref:chorismate mutase n=1 Tax=Chromobacterium amazonense TaxID=1382803 RepID=A0A2S9X1L0_9NEIS|nr:chorismate mutase [Chromobacterium amazonense]PRP69614.1 hypothetical protein BUE93_17775 [Chromobacterium amazonense]